PLGHRVRGAAAAAGEYRNAAGARLQVDDPEPFHIPVARRGGEHEDVRRVVERDQLLALRRSGKGDAVADAELPGELFEPRPVVSAARNGVVQHYTRRERGTGA